MKVVELIWFERVLKEAAVVDRVLNEFLGR